MKTSVLGTQQEAPALPDDVWVNWIGDFRRWVEPTTDAAIEGIFAVASLELALCIGRDVAVHYGRPTYANLYEVVIGPTGVPRKSTVVSRGHDVRKKAFTSDFVRVVRSIGSGEGLLKTFCSEEIGPKSKKVTLKPIPKQRVVLDEPEVCALLKKARRVGTANIIETILALFDGDDFSPRTRTRPIRVTEPFFNLITTSTPENLEMSLTDVDIDYGLIPRFAFFFCNAREPMAYPPTPDEAVLAQLAKGLQDIASLAKEVGEKRPIITLSPQAQTEWEATFKDINQAIRQEKAMVAALIVRIPTMIMKWALIFAMQSGRAEINSENLARATLVGTYLMETAQLVPRFVQKSPIARIEDKIIKTLSLLSGQYLSTNEIHKHVSGRIKAEELRRSLQSLANLGIIEEGTTEKGMRGYRIAGQ